MPDYAPNEDFDLLAKRLSEDLPPDEEKILDEMGADLFATAKLIELKGRYEERLSQFDGWQRFFLKMAMWSPVFLPAGLGLLWAGVGRAGWVLLTAFPVLLSVALLCIGALWQKTGGRSGIEYRLRQVHDALSARASTARRPKN